MPKLIYINYLTKIYIYKTNINNKYKNITKKEFLTFYFIRTLLYLNTQRNINVMTYLFIPLMTALLWRLVELKAAHSLGLNPLHSGYMH